MEKGNITKKYMIHVLKYDVEFTEYIYLGAYLLQKFHRLSLAEAEKTETICIWKVHN